MHEYWLNFSFPYKEINQINDFIYITNSSSFPFLWIAFWHTELILIRLNKVISINMDQKQIDEFLATWNIYKPHTLFSIKIIVFYFAVTLKLRVTFLIPNLQVKIADIHMCIYIYKNTSKFYFLFHFRFHLMIYLLILFFHLIEQRYRFQKCIMGKRILLES